MDRVCLAAAILCLFGVPAVQAADCNSNGIQDAMEIAAGTSPDCNSNGIPDDCDIAIGTSDDCGTNGIPDECEEGCSHSTAACPDADINCDNVADGFDVAIVKQPANWMKSRDDADEPRADVNCDGFIDGFASAAGTLHPPEGDRFAFPAIRRPRSRPGVRPIVA